MYRLDSLLNCRCLNRLCNEDVVKLWKQVTVLTNRMPSLPISIGSFNKERPAKDNLTQKFRI